MLSCSPDQTTNSETTNSNFQKQSDQLKDSEFVVSELIIGSGEQNILDTNKFQIV